MHHQPTQRDAGDFESFPTARARGYVDVIDLGLAIRAQQAAVGATFPVTKPALPITHHVQFGTSGVADFRCFPDALAFYIDHVNDRHPPRVLGAFHDDDHDGLTEDEQLAVQAAEQERVR